MKPGKEYEEFVYQKFKDLFVGFEVTLNDKILGKQSNIRREIDVSVKGNVENIYILYLVQCKDHNKPADVKIIGEFSAVIKDVGASKGFLICSAGFAKTIHTYAKSLGIDLMTIEDINSQKWNIDIEIPIIYIHKKLHVAFNYKIHTTAELAEKNKVDLTVTNLDFEIVSLDNGKSRMKVIDYLNYVIELEKIDVEKIADKEINNPNLMLYFAELWVPITLTFQFKVEIKYYLKYIRPEEYSQISNHVTKEKIPLKVKFSNDFELNDEYVEIQKENAPITATVLLEVEENLFPINQLTLDMTNFELNF